MKWWHHALIGAGVAVFVVGAIVFAISYQTPMEQNEVAMPEKPKAVAASEPATAPASQPSTKPATRASNEPATKPAPAWKWSLPGGETRLVDILSDPDAHKNRVLLIYGTVTLSDYRVNTGPLTENEFHFTEYDQMNRRTTRSATLTTMRGSAKSLAKQTAEDERTGKATGWRLAVTPIDDSSQTFAVLDWQTFDETGWRPWMNGEYRHGEAFPMPKSRDSINRFIDERAPTTQPLTPH